LEKLRKIEGPYAETTLDGEREVRAVPPNGFVRGWRSRDSRRSRGELAVRRRVVEFRLRAADEASFFGASNQ
jgi:hypothetical protein